MIIKKTVSVVLILSFLVCSFTACSNATNEQETIVSTFSNSSKQQNSGEKVVDDSSTESKPLKIYTPKTVYELFRDVPQGYDRIKLWEPKQVTQMTQAEVLKYTEEAFALDLPDSTVFEPGGVIDFNYELKNEYVYKQDDYDDVMVVFKKVITYYSEKEVQNLRNQMNSENTEWRLIDKSQGSYSYGIPGLKSMERIEEAVGDFYNTDFELFLYADSPMLQVNCTTNRYVCIKKDENKNKYLVVFEGHVNNEHLYNGTVTIK